MMLMLHALAAARVLPQAAHTTAAAARGHERVMAVVAAAAAATAIGEIDWRGRGGRTEEVALVARRPDVRRRAVEQAADLVEYGASIARRRRRRAVLARQAGGRRARPLEAAAAVVRVMMRMLMMLVLLLMMMMRGVMVVVVVVVAVVVVEAGRGRLLVEYGIAERAMQYVVELLLASASICRVTPQLRLRRRCWLLVSSRFGLCCRRC